MEPRNKGNEIGKAVIRMMIIAFLSMMFGMMAEMAGRGNIWGIGGIIAMIAVAVMAGTMQRRGREYVGR